MKFYLNNPHLTDCQVTSFTGVWVEMDKTCMPAGTAGGSHPSRVCGLKYPADAGILRYTNVTSFTGVWVEIF